MNHSKDDLARAVVEGNAFAFADIALRLRELGLGGQIRVVGGGRRSNFSLVAKATLTGSPVHLVTAEESTAVGGAMLAALGAGIFSTMAECVDAVVELAPETIEPDPALKDVLSCAYAEYRKLYDCLEESFAGGRQ
jgi:xylulokinase